MAKALYFLFVFVFPCFLFSQNLKKHDLLITEIMFDPTPEVGLPDEEYIEIYNNSDKSISLSNIQLAIGKKTITLGDLTLIPNSFKLIEDKDIPALKNTGDSLKIISMNTVIHEVLFNPSMHSSNFKQEGGWSIELADFSKPCLIDGNWLSSEHKSGGTPGVSNSNSINIVPQPVEITSYFPASDSTLKLDFNTPVNSIESNYSFNASSNYVAIPKLDSLSIDSISIVSVKTCFDTEFKTQTIKYGLPIEADSGSLLINEILFNPDAEGSDFVELFNSSSIPINLTNLSFSTRDENGELGSLYKLSDIPTLILPKEYVVFCEDILWLKKTFPKSKNATEIKLPAMNNEKGVIVLTNKSGVSLDEIQYADSWHYSEFNDLENVSLEKIIPGGENSSSNWTSSVSSENFATPGYKNSNMHYPATSQTSNYRFYLPYEVITPNADGHRDHLIIQYNFDKPDWTGQINVVNYLGETIHSLSSNSLFGLKGNIVWDGLLKSKLEVPAGIYVLWINAYNLKNHERINQKLPFYINKKI